MGSTSSEGGRAGAPSIADMSGVCWQGNPVISPEEVSEWPHPENCDAQNAAHEQYRHGPFEHRELSVAHLAGTWVDRTSPTRVELVLDEAGAGTLLYGEEQALPEITDPTEPHLYVPNIDREIYPMLGFRYTVFARDGRGSEMTFSISFNEPWSEWCALQPPRLGSGCHACEYAGNGTLIDAKCGCVTEISSLPDAKIRTDCARFWLCLSRSAVCACNATECFASLTTNNPSNYTATLDPLDTTVLRLTTETTSDYLAKQ